MSVIYFSMYQNEKVKCTLLSSFVNAKQATFWGVGGGLLLVLACHLSMRFHISNFFNTTWPISIKFSSKHASMDEGNFNEDKKIKAT